MSTMPTDAVRCGSCGTLNPPAHAYCGGCGSALGATGARGGSSRARYRAPRRLLVISGALFVVSGLVAAAAFTAIQGSGASGIAMDIGGPVVNRLLDAAGIDQIRAPRADSGGTSWLVVLAFMGAFLIACLSLFFVVCAGAWLLKRRLSSESDRAALVEASRRQAVAARELSTREYAKAKPKIAEAAQKGRKAYDADVKPRVAAGAEKGRQWLARRRGGPPGG